MQIKVSDVLEMMDKGMSRIAIGNHYGLSFSDRTLLFKNKQFANKRIKKASEFELVDDTVKTADIEASIEAADNADTVFSVTDIMPTDDVQRETIIADLEITVIEDEVGSEIITEGLSSIAEEPVAGTELEEEQDESQAEVAEEATESDNGEASPWLN